MYFLTLSFNFLRYCHSSKIQVVSITYQCCNSIEFKPKTHLSIFFIKISQLIKSIKIDASYGHPDFSFQTIVNNDGDVIYEKLIRKRRI